jgi:type I restriction enzyme S subunit
MQKLQLKKEYQKYPEYKNSGVDWLGEIPKEWRSIKVKYIGKTIAGGTPSTSEPEYWDGEISWLPSGAIQNCIVTNKKAKYITELALKNSATKLIKPSSVLIALTGATCANIGFLPFESTANQSVIAVHNNENIASKYLYYSFLANREQFLVYKTGGAQSGINENNVKNIFITSPPKQDQQKIANFLDEKVGLIDEIVKKKKRLIDLLKEKRTAVINQAVTKGLDSNVEMKDSGVEWIGEVPNSWEVKKIKYLGNAIIGLIYSPDDVTDETGTLVLRSSNVQNGKIKLEDNVYVNKKISNKLTTRKGDILICSRNGSRKLIGKNACIDENSEGLSFGAFMTIFRTIHWHFISYFLKSNVFMSQLSTTLTSTINQLTIHNLNNIVAAIPLAVEQERIVEYLGKETERIDVLMKKVKESINLLTEFKSSLISNVVTGKVKV